MINQFLADMVEEKARVIIEDTLEKNPPPAVVLHSQPSF